MQILSRVGWGEGGGKGKVTFSTDMRERPLSQPRQFRYITLGGGEAKPRYVSPQSPDDALLDSQPLLEEICVVERTSRGFPCTCYLLKDLGPVT